MLTAALPALAHETDSVQTGEWGMMSMMTGGGTPNAGVWGTFMTLGWIWTLVWTINSILLGILLWRLIKKYSK